jgi:hypothetical protein
MKYLTILTLLILSALMLSCEDDEKQRQAETIKAARQSDSIFKILSSNWKFNIAPPAPKVAMSLTTWNEWQQFKTELSQKPKGSIEAYRQKVQNLVNKADLLRNNIPAQYDKPQVRSRMGVLITKIKSLYTYISIDVIPDKKVLALINEVSYETESIQNQFDEIIRISEIPKEMGEEEMLRALDTVRMANPGMQPDPNTQPAQPQLKRLVPAGHGAGYIKQSN